MSFLSKLFRRPRRAPKTVSVKRTAIGVEQLEGRDVPAAMLYSHDVVGRLYEVNSETGQSRLIGNTGVALQDIAFDGAGRLFGVSTTGQLYGIDSGTAAVEQLTATGAQLNSLASGPDGHLYAATANGTTGSTLYRYNLTLKR
jgi:outer membrane protein assembly factor BamB